jgi:hypothetical protein
MLKTSAPAFLLFLVFCSASFGQSSGVLPLTGIIYFNEGIWGKYVDVTIDGTSLVNNKIPANKEFVVKLQLPTGFTEDASKKIYPAAEVSFLSAGRQLLATAGNILKDNEKAGFASSTYKEIPLKLSIRTEWLKAATECIVQVRYYDLKSKKQLRVLFPVKIASVTESLSVSKIPLAIKTSDGSAGMSNALQIPKADISIDTSIRVAPKNAYLSIDMPGITGTSMNEVLGGTNNFWVYDKNMNEVKISDKLLKKVGGSMEDNIVNFTVKVPFRLKTDLTKGYTIRFRWESTDKKKIIDIVSTK